MKTRDLLLASSAIGLVLLSSFAVFYPGGAPVAVTGSPGDGANCTQCHGGTANSASGWITSNIPAGGYIPGQIYQITATNSLTGSGKYGFEVSPQNTSGTQLGTLAAGTNCQMMGNGKYVTHSNASSSVKVWTFPWTAPATGTGNVTFYGAFALNYPGATTLSTLLVSEQTNTGISDPTLPSALIFPNPNNGQFTVKIPESMQNNDGTLEILNVSGNTVTKTKYTSKNNRDIHMDISSSPRGVYFLILQNPSENKFEKFIIK
jgi:Secretion system C-terminal sorting domain/Reeler domain